jgi:hypothetical protein
VGFVAGLLARWVQALGSERAEGVTELVDIWEVVVGVEEEVWGTEGARPDWRARRGRLHFR